MEPEDVMEYSTMNYWNSRFAQEESYDWLVTFADIEALLREYIPTDRPISILHLGCGNSPLSTSLKTMLHPGSYLCNQDYSQVLIDNMKSLHGEIPGEFEWMVGDMTNLDSAGFPPASFDVIIEKASLDALTVNEGDPWNPREEVVENVRKVMQGVAGLLKDDGKSVFLSISFHQKHFRLKLLNGAENGLDIQVKDIPTTKSLPHFFYVCKPVERGEQPGAAKEI
jgi:hypothetical protein